VLIRDSSVVQSGCLTSSGSGVRIPLPEPFVGGALGRRLALQASRDRSDSDTLHQSYIFTLPLATFWLIVTAQLLLELWGLW
jgi:hypothetical protein